MRRGILGLLVLVLACVAAPAQGDDAPGSVVGVNGVLYDDCLNYPYRYSAMPPADAQDWEIQTELIGPDGTQAESDRISVDALSGQGSFFLCQQSNPYGRYTIRATFDWLDGDSVWQSAPLASSTFTLRKPRSLTKLTASTRRPAYGQRVTYRIRAYDEKSTGFLPRAFAWVHLEKRSHGHWVRIKGSRAMTHSTGAVKVRVRYLKRHHRTLKVRAVTERTVKFTRSVSPVVRVW